MKHASKVLAVLGAGAGVYAAYKLSPKMINYALFGVAGLGLGYFVGKKFEPKTTETAKPTGAIVNAPNAAAAVSNVKNKDVKQASEAATAAAPVSTEQSPAAN